MSNPIKRPNSNSGSLGKFKRSRERMIHLSAAIIEHPAYTIAKAEGKPYYGPMRIAARGITYRKAN